MMISMPRYSVATLTGRMYGRPRLFGSTLILQVEESVQEYERVWPRAGDERPAGRPVGKPVLRWRDAMWEDLMVVFNIREQQ